MFKAIAKMHDETHEWNLTILSHCESFMEAEIAARRFVSHHPYDCSWIQVINDEEPEA